MARRVANASAATPTLPPLPLAVELWDQVAASLALAPQQKRIVELILRGLRDKEIAVAMKLSVPTVRTYLGRIFLRTGVRDRMELALKAFLVSHQING